MSKVNGGKLTRILTVAGIALILASVVLIGISAITEKRAEKRAGEIVETLRSLMPEAADGVPDDRVNLTMPMLELDGENFVGIFEIPKYESALPICGVWESGKVSDYPCRYIGNMYDGSLIIGGSDNQGQFDFTKLITADDVVYITDVTGLRYSYVVTEISKTTDVSTENLVSSEADLVLFARNTYSLDYTVIRCVLKGKR